MKTDIFQVYPTDGYVNNRRANYPFGEVGTSSWLSENGSKVGNCSYSGCNGTVFEPIDNYKGDFAERRSIIYTLAFTTKFYLYGPVTSSKVIKTVQVDQYTDMKDQAPKREQRYTVTPNPASADADDDFGFNETSSFFQDAKNFDPESGEDK